MPNVSFQELTDVLQKSGLPFGNSEEMDKASLYAEDQIRGQIPMADFGGEGIKQARMQQIAQIAQMDQKLAGVFSDPSSDLYIERASSREPIRSSAYSTGHGAVSNITNLYKTRKAEAERELELKVDKAVSMYSKLTTLQAREEARLEREAKKTGKGNSSTVNQAISQIKKGRYDLAGLVDPDAIAVYERTPADFQKQWVTEYQQAIENGDASVDASENYYTADDIKGAYEVWVQKTSLPTKAELKKKEKQQQKTRF